jgi:hypothetical protein
MALYLGEVKHQWTFEPTLSLGMNQQNEFDGRYYANASAELGIYKPFSNVYRMGFCADAFYNDAFRKERTLPAYYAGEDNKIRGGLSWANELMFGDFVTGVHAGVYLYNPIKHDGFVYFKVVGKYHVSDNLFVSLAVKTHMQVAECTELGLGYVFSRKEKTPYKNDLSPEDKTRKYKKPPKQKYFKPVKMGRKR